MFISTYTTICFFEKKLIFSNIYISVNSNVFMFFLLRKGPSIKYVRSWWGIQSAYSCVQGEGVSRLMCAYALILLHYLEDLEF